MIEFKKYKLGDIADIIVSTVDKKSKPGQKTVRLCNFVDVYKNWAITHDMYNDFMVATASEVEIQRFTIKKGQVAFTKDSETRDDIGIATYIADDFDDVVLGYHTALVTPHEDILLGKYLNAFMHSKYVLKYFEMNATGSGMRYTLSLETLNDIPVLVPSLEEQKRIGDFFSAIDKKICLNRKANAELEALAKQIYDYWFVQFDFPDENGRPYKSSGGKMVYDTNLKRDIPFGWESVKLTEIANITMGQSPDGKSYNTKGEGTIFFQGSTDFGEFAPEVRMFTTSPSRMAKAGDILMSVRAPVGTLNMSSTNCCVGRGLAALNSKIGSTTYLYYVLKYAKPYFDNLNSNGTTFGAITKDDLHGVKTIKPDATILDKFEQLCSKMMNERFKFFNENLELTYLKNFILPLLMNGQASLL